MGDREEEMVMFIEDGPLQGCYVTEYDPWANNRRGLVDGSPDIEAALGFANFQAALEFRNQEAGVRPDGKPNRPLTASTITFVRRKIARQNHPERRFYPLANSYVSPSKPRKSGE